MLMMILLKTAMIEVWIIICLIGPCDFLSFAKPPWFIIAVMASPKPSDGEDFVWEILSGATSFLRKIGENDPSCQFVGIAVQYGKFVVVPEKSWCFSARNQISLTGFIDNVKMTT